MNRISTVSISILSVFILAIFTLWGAPAAAQSCPSGSYACADGSGCCQDGLICGTGSNGCDANRCCQPGCGSGQKSCGNGCIPSDADCCSNGNYCNAGTYCTVDGRCETSSGGGGGGGGGATCDVGYKVCDGQYCIPNDGVCCSTGGGNYCNAGTYCTASGCASDGGGGGTGGGTCPANFKSCDGQYCIPADAQCCGNGNGNYCNAGSSCTAGGCASDSGGGCPSGYKSCGSEWCIPTANDCCGNGRYCPEGSRCDGQGGCDRDSNTAPSGSGGGCDPGFTVCDSQWCMPADAVCCGEGRYCPSGTSCTAGGTCASDTTTSNTGSDGVSGFSSAADGDETCSTALEGAASCRIEFCLPNDDPCAGRYIVNGDPVRCLDSCNQSSLQNCADDAVRKCEEIEDAGGCQTVAAPGDAAPLFFTLVALVLGMRQKRRE